jgi:MFS family permease
VERETGQALPPPSAPTWIRGGGSISFGGIARILFIQHPRRTAFGLCLMITQAFAYNAIFFTYALVLGKFYGVPSSRIGLYLLPFSVGNLLGPLVLGSYFDTIGRKKMIALTYGLAGALLWLTGYAFEQGWLTATTQTLCWCLVFFVASAAASSAYLTVSEIFPIEMRGMAIAIFYAVGTAVGGVAAPSIFSALIQTGSRFRLYEGYVFGAVLLIFAAGVTLLLGVSAERKSLEAIAAF